MPDGIGCGVVTTDRVEVRHLRDFLSKVGTDSPLQSVERRYVPAVFFGIGDGIVAM
ncbi:hypothetical protein GXB81_19665 [Paraburkholderia sp. Ac-20336]|uniref:hypothetical protein n=1 Tax=Paraburkholderia sp. Ac-20336 TaxID=2703886 RepID=UPI00197FE595|nr:hypothetical protein [Paraburkholderia sp. Ac-20336]MBN3805249.1 hypothetical protein [Paraburkholderia sp. Ac-20336]